MTTKADFVRFFGPIRPREVVNVHWQECRVPCRDYPHCDPMFDGRFWTSGYFMSDENPAGDDLFWAEIIQDAQASHALAKRLANVVVHSDTDSPYFSCFFRLRKDVPFEMALKAALGWQVDAEFEQSSFWGDMQVRFLASESDAFFWHPLDDDVVDEYYSARELNALRDVTAIMKTLLKDLCHVTFPEAYVAYPNFWMGRTAHGSWLGVWALRVDT